MTEPLTGAPLADDAEFTPLFRAWLGGERGLTGASEQWGRCLAWPSPAGTPAPAWAAAAWREPWLADLLDDQPDAGSRLACAGNVARLAGGEADVLVTGQQPGFLGGPLYTLYKTAAVVAAAAARTAAGRPSVPLFWSADDDDDRVEAFAPWLWDPRRRVLLRAAAVEGPAGRMIGAVPGAEWGAGEAAWLNEQARRGGLAAELAALWRSGCAEGVVWGHLQRRALLRLFAGSGLLVVSGDDPRLHAAAAAFYERLWGRRADLAQAARQAGEALTKARFHAQLGEGSLSRPLHVAESGRRLTLGDQGTLPEPARLRPGVLLRSAVQDWLFRPAGVVVGPGECAYLIQMQGVYNDLSLVRSPLLPRLFATVTPEDEVSGFLGEAGPIDRDGDWRAVAAPLEIEGARLLETALRQACGGDGERARLLARREAARWGDAMRRLLAREAARQGPGDAAGLSPWVRPLGRRQERTLAVHWATALWGDGFVTLAREAARRHFVAGATGPWRHFVLPVAAPT